MGTCRNGENCNFAHGIEDMRQPPPNWQELVGVRDEDRPPSGNWDDDKKLIHKMKLCKKYYNGEECPYGERCNFLHEDPAKFRECSAISIGTNGSPKSHMSGTNDSESNRTANNTGLDVVMVNSKATFWKTKLCIRWETTGRCPFSDKCHFAHGQAGTSSCYSLFLSAWSCFIITNYYYDSTKIWVLLQLCEGCFDKGCLPR